MFVMLMKNLPNLLIHTNTYNYIVNLKFKINVSACSACNEEPPEAARSSNGGNGVSV